MADLRNRVHPLPDLGDTQRGILKQILGASLAWQTVNQLAVATGLDEETLLDAIADLDAGGWVDSWERDPQPVVTLSVAGAARLGARIVERGPSMTPRWALRGEPDPPEPPATHVSHGERSAGLAALPDPSPGPEMLAILYEEQAIRQPARMRRSRRLQANRFPFPTILLGTSLSPWPGPMTFRHGNCPACRSRPLRPRMYCLGCDRWGFDHALNEEAESPQGIEMLRDVEFLRRDREQRSSRRRARLHAESECCRRKRGLHPHPRN